MSAEPQPAVKRQKINPNDFVCEAAKAISFKWLEHGPSFSEADMETATRTFPPEMCHQLFGEHEEIKGYSGLAVDIWISARTYHTWIDIRFNSKRYTAMDLPGILKEQFPAGYASSREELVNQVGASKPPDVFQLGRTVVSRQLPDGSELHIQLHQLAKSDPDIMALHNRMQPLLLFFVDGASFIEQDDPRWDLLLAVRRHDGKDSVVGFTTLYNFYAYPDQTRLRLSQILVLPPFQRHGIGRDMMQAAYQLAAERQVIDLTVEDPSPGLQKLRDKMDLEVMMSLPWLQELAQQVASSASTADAEHAVDNGNELAAAANGDLELTPKAAASSSKQVRSPLALPADALARVRQERKLHKSQIKAIWEAVLFLQPSIQTPQGMSALKQLVGVRLEALLFGGAPADAAAQKSIVDRKDGEVIVFEMMRRRGVMGEGNLALIAAVGAPVPVGRRNIVQMDPEIKAQALTDALTERMTDLETLTTAWRKTVACS